MTRAPELLGIPKDYIFWGLIVAFVPFPFTKSIILLVIMSVLVYVTIRVLVALDPHVLSILAVKLRIGLTANRNLFGGNNYEL